MLLAVTEAVFEIVAVVLQDVEGLVLDLPPRPPAGGQVGDRIAPDRQVSDEAVAVGDVSGGVADLDLEPVDLECVAAVAQRHLGQPAEPVRDPFAATFDPHAVGRQFNPGDVFPDQRVRCRLAGEHEVAACGLDRFAHRLVGEQVVAQVDRPEPGILRTMRAQPAPGRAALAILLVAAILRDDELRRQRHDVIVPGCHQRCPQHGMVALDLSVRTPPRRTLRAGDLAGAEIFAAIEGDQHVLAEPAERGQPARAFQLRQHLGKDRVQQRRRRRVEHGANVIVAGDFLQTEQAGAIRPAVALLQPPLMRQERWTLHEEHRERRHADVGDPVGPVAPAARVGKALATPAQGAEQGFQAVHPPDESYSAAVSIRRIWRRMPFRRPCGNPDSPPCPG